jgi:hypothetical protein
VKAIECEDGWRDGLVARSTIRKSGGFEGVRKRALTEIERNRVYCHFLVSVEN